MLTTTVTITSGDILFCVNSFPFCGRLCIDHYISPTNREVDLFKKIQEIIKSQETSTLRLIHRNDIVYAFD